METTEYRGYTIEIKQDMYPESPREWDNLGTMICFHKRYELGDKHKYESGDYDGWDDMYKQFSREFAVILPLYLLDHSGLAMSTNRSYPFNCPWDAGQVGFIVCSRKQIKREYGCKRITKQILEKVEKLLESEVETYNQYLQGDIYGYVVTGPDGVERDSCWGYYGYDYCVQEAQGIVDWYESEECKSKAAQMELGAGI
jgi:hypothetical protein